MSAMELHKKEWERLQETSLNRYTKMEKTEKNLMHLFSTKRWKGANVLGKTMEEMIPCQHCLDIGCGLLPLPVYMEVAKSVTFTGVDPHKVEVKREFEFVSSIAENLPFEDESFDNICFASSLDHCIDPIEAIKEGFRVLKKGGYIFIWSSIVFEDDIKKWKERGGIFNQWHLHGFCDKDILEMFKGAELIKYFQVAVGEIIYIFQK